MSSTAGATLRTSTDPAAHLGAVAQGAGAEEIVVLSSDPGDMVRACAPKPITAVRI